MNSSPVPQSGMGEVARDAVARRRGPLLGTLALLAACATIFVTPALAAPNQDFPLGQSASSGAVCQAVQEFQDPAIQFRGAKAWSIHCRGWDVALGRLYAFDRDGPHAIGPDSVWQAQLAQRAKCGAAQNAAVAGLDGVQRRTCQSVPGDVAYSAYTIVQGDSAAAAEGFVPLTDLIEAGLKIVTGAAPVPASAMQAQPLGEYVGGVGGSETSGLADAANAAQQTADWLLDKAHIENQGWLFGDAERDFRALAASDQVSDKERAQAELNLALNISNQGRFSEADGRFAEADAIIKKTGDPQLESLALNYRSLHLLNQRRFADAEALARKSIALRQTIDPSVESPGTVPALKIDGGHAIEISATLAAGLNERGDRSTGLSVVHLTPSERLEVQTAQAYYIIGVSLAQLGDAAGARKALDQANAILAQPRLAFAAAWLQSQIFGEIARLDLKAGQSGAAHDEFQRAIDIFLHERNLLPSPAEANLYLGLAQTEAIAGQKDRALSDYATGFELFRQSRRSLGDSRNAAAPYLDLLIAEMNDDPAKARAFQDQYFNVMQIVVGQSTAKTLALLVARMSGGDDRSKTLARELEDTRRQLTIKAAEIKRAQDSGNYPDAAKTADQAALTALSDEAVKLQQQLLSANPHYGQLVEETATLDTLQKALTPGEVYVKTVLLADRGYALAVTSDSVKAYPIPLTQSQVDEKVKSLREPFDDPNTVGEFDVPASHELFVAVFGPVQDEVRAARHLIYEPDSRMVRLPATTFVTDDASVRLFKERDAKASDSVDLYQGIAWLGRNTDVSVVVSAASFLQTRGFKPSSAQRKFIGFGDPVTKGPDPRRYALLVDPSDPVTRQNCERVREQWATVGPGPLPGIAETIRTVGREYGAGPSDIVLGPAFTDVDVRTRQDLNQYRIVFFGTHAVLPSKQACLPLPVLATSLASGKDSDGFLDASEILGLKMDADMVVLAACDTGGAGGDKTDRTGLTGSGDALSGLARDFIYAGARAVMVSQWEVDAEATAQLMADIFKHSTTSQADALRQAETALMDNKHFSHPYFWAPFTLVGDGAKPMPTN
jgi:CHAT domain-containing protein